MLAHFYVFYFSLLLFIYLGTLETHYNSNEMQFYCLVSLKKDCCLYGIEDITHWFHSALSYIV